MDFFIALNVSLCIFNFFIIRHYLSTNDVLLFLLQFNPFFR